jgi:hypothetical protein
MPFGTSEWKGAPGNGPLRASPAAGMTLLCTTPSPRCPRPHAPCNRPAPYPNAKFNSDPTPTPTLNPNRNLNLNPNPNPSPQALAAEYERQQAVAVAAGAAAARAEQARANAAATALLVGADIEASGRVTAELCAAGSARSSRPHPEVPSPLAAALEAGTTPNT